MKMSACAKLLLAVAVTVLALGGCGGDGDGVSPTEPTASSDEGGDAGAGGGQETASARGVLRILMIDAPTDEICELHVYIQDLRVKPDGMPQKLLGTELGDFDLLALQDAPPAVLGDFPVDQGRYQFLEILLDQGRSYVVEKEAASGEDEGGCRAEQSELQVPSSKFKVNGGPFDVDESTTVTIDFDAEKSLRRKGGNSSQYKVWHLYPEVSMS